MTTSYCRHSPSLSRTGNMWYPSTFLYSNKVESTIHRLRRSPFLSRKELHTACFPFAKLLYVYLFIRDHSTFPCNPHGGVRGLWASAHQAYFPSYKHTAFYFPPAATKDRAVHSMEIKDFIILWTYSQWRQALVVIPPFSPERSIVSHAFLFLAFLFLRFHKVEEV